jgi:hypothetical protein
MSDRQRPNAAGSLTAQLSVDDLMRLADQAPEVYRDILHRDEEAARRHHELARTQARQQWAVAAAHIIGNVCAVASLGLLTTLSWHAFDVGAPVEGASIICTGAASIVAVFVTGRLTNARRTPSPRQPGR